eukprot:jgi/Botrbrau1/22564/Bobra.0830s0001.1
MASELNPFVHCTPDHGYPHIDLRLWPQQIGMKINVSHAPLSAVLARRRRLRHVVKSKDLEDHTEQLKERQHACEKRSTLRPCACSTSKQH